MGMMAKSWKLRCLSTKLVELSRKMPVSPEGVMPQYGGPRDWDVLLGGMPCTSWSSPYSIRQCFSVPLRLQRS